MKYEDLKDQSEITGIIKSLKGLVPNLARVILPSEYETTMRGLKVLTVFDRFEPVMKIEGEGSLIDLFRKALEEEQTNYKARK